MLDIKDLYKENYIDTNKLKMILIDEKGIKINGE